MDSLANFLLLMVLLTISLSTKVISHNTFSIDLIRRESSSTTLQGGGQKRPIPLGSVSNHHNIRLSSTLYNTNDIQTTVIPDGGSYVMKISVGSPPIEFTAVADTGSDLMWVQCVPCRSCKAQQTPFFNPTKSSTNTKVACTSQICDADQLGLVATGCTQNDNTCAYIVRYGDGTQSSESTGILSTETITFSSPQTSFPGLFFGCGYNQQGHFGYLADGIIGLGGGPLSLITQLGPNINYKFSYCLTPSSSGVNSKLNFGLDVTGPGVVSTPINNQQNTENTPPTFYYLTLNSITIGTTSITVNNNLIIDSGTTLTYLPSNVYDTVRNTMKGAIGLKPVDDPSNVFDPCYDSASAGQGGFNPPDTVFHFNGADVVLKAENSFWDFNGLTCLAMIPADEGFIFGNIAQVNYHVGYDLKANQVSFAQADCSNF